MPLPSHLASMRDRRNTNLSISSASTVSPAASPIITEGMQDDAEKGRFLWIRPVTTGHPLPSPLLKHARESHPSLLDTYRSRCSWRKPLIFLAVVSLYLCYHCRSLIDYSAPSELSAPPPDRKFYLEPGAGIPQDPTPLIFQDDKGRPKWTISIPTSLTFPLRPHQYRDICQASERVGNGLESLVGHSRIIGRSHSRTKPYYAGDKAFVDVAEAESMGLLSSPDSQVSISVVGRNQSDASNDSKVCDKTLTYVMESENAGFGSALLSLWLAYGLANKEGRDFFVDDSNWPYGRYLSYFPAPPQPSCSPPPAHQVLPCPHNARHLVVSAATFPWTFGSAFKDQFTHTRKSGVSKNREIYDMMRTGYNQLFGLVGDDAEFLDHRVSDLRKTSASTGAPVVGIHIRRGDRHPYELQFSNDYLPFERYTGAATEMFTALAPNFTVSAESHVSLLLASDDPDIYDSPDLANTLPAEISVVRSQERIVLASKKTLAPAIPLRDGAYTKHVDENSGWEGGFYSRLFFGLGGGHPSTTAPAEVDQEVKRQAMTLRNLVGRGYLLDLGVLSRSDAVVCASSSAACRILGVMMGWDKIVKGHWKNVDAARHWSWDGQ